MEFACSHVVCNWKAEGTDPAPPPLPPRRLRKPRPTSLPIPLHPTMLPPIPPRTDILNPEDPLSFNINVVSLAVGELVDFSRDSHMDPFESPVLCGKCSAALSGLSSLQGKLWVCEFCGRENVVDDSVPRVCVGQRTGVCSDDLYLPNCNDDDYQNLEDVMVVFCVDVSGSMGVTTEVPSSSGSSAYVSRLQSMQDALRRALSSLLQRSPHRRVALVTFNNEVVIYGDGTRAPVTLRDWALLDYDHIWKEGVAYSIPHCIAESHQQLMQAVQELREDGATCLGPAVLASVAMASQYPGSKVIVCTDGRANIGLGEMEDTPPPLASFFYRRLAGQAAESGVIVSVMTFEGTDCRLAEIGRMADTTGGRVNIVTMGTVATEIQLATEDNVLATGVTATLLAPEGVFFPYEADNNKIVKQIGNVTRGQEITFQFSLRPELTEVFLQRRTLPFQLQLRFKSREQQPVTRVLTEQRPVTLCSDVKSGGLNVAILGVHCAQLCASLTMEGRVQEAQRQLRAQEHLLLLISNQRPIRKEEGIYGNWVKTMTRICDDIGMESQPLSDEAAEVVYQLKRASSSSAADSQQGAKRRRQKLPKQTQSHYGRGQEVKRSHGRSATHKQRDV